MGAFFQAAPYLGFVLIQQIVDELLARIICDALGRVHQTQGRRRYHRLLDRHVCVAHGNIQVTVCVPPITERATCEPRQATCMTVPERDNEAVRSRIRKPMHAVRAEIVILPLFAVGNHRRACRLKLFNGLPNRIFIERVQARIFAIALCDSLDEINGPWDTANWLGRYRDWRSRGHISCLARSIDDLTAFGAIRILWPLSRRAKATKVT